MKDKRQIATIIFEELSSVYCYNCHYKESGDGCDDCHRKAMGWAISLDAANAIADKILQEGKDAEV